MDCKTNADLMRLKRALRQHVSVEVLDNNSTHTANTMESHRRIMLCMWPSLPSIINCSAVHDKVVSAAFFALLSRFSLQFELPDTKVDFLRDQQLTVSVAGQMGGRS